MFYLVQQFAEDYRVTIQCIYLEAGHDKGIPDGIGAVVKKAVQDIIAFNPDIPHSSVKDLLESGLQGKLPSIGIITYSKDAVISLAKNILGTTDIVQGFPYWGSPPTNRKFGHSPHQEKSPPPPTV